MKTDLEPILKFTDTRSYDGNPEDMPGNYSFGKSVYEDFVKRRARIKDNLGLRDDVEFHMVGAIKNDNEKRQYTLETAVGFNSQLSSGLLTTINFLVNMTEDPQKILEDRKSQGDFEKAAFLLRGEEVKVKEAFNLKDAVQKKYGFDEYLFYDSEGDILRYHAWETPSDKRIAVPKEESIHLLLLRSALSALNKKGLIGFNYEKIVELKKHYRSQFFKKAQKKDIAYYRKIVEEEQKLDHPLFLITRETSFKEVLEGLQENELLSYFPFSSKLDVEFLAEVLRSQFGQKE